MAVIVNIKRPNPLEGLAEAGSILANALLKRQEREALTEDQGLVSQFLSKYGGNLTSPEAQAALQEMQFLTPEGPKLLNEALAKVVTRSPLYLYPGSTLVNAVTGQPMYAAPDRPQTLGDYHVALPRSGGGYEIQELSPSQSTRALIKQREAQTEQTQVQTEGLKQEQEQKRQFGPGTATQQQDVWLLQQWGLDPKDPKSWETLNSIKATKDPLKLNQFAAEQATSLTKQYYDNNPEARDGYEGVWQRHYRNILTTMQDKFLPKPGYTAEQVHAQFEEAVRKRPDLRPLLEKRRDELLRRLGQ